MYDKVSVNPSKYGLRSHLWKISWKDWGLCKEHINHIGRNFIIIIIIIFLQSQRDIIWSCDLKGGSGIWRTLAKMFTFRRNCSCSSGHRASSLCMGNCWKHPNCLAQLLHNKACCEVTCLKCFLYMDVSENSGTPKSSILIGFSSINHPFWGTTFFGNTHICNISLSHISVHNEQCHKNGLNELRLQGRSEFQR